jgi:hypothetical protein
MVACIRRRKANLFLRHPFFIYTLSFLIHAATAICMLFSKMPTHLYNDEGNSPAAQSLLAPPPAQPVVWQIGLLVKVVSVYCNILAKDSVPFHGKLAPARSLKDGIFFPFFRPGPFSSILGKGLY